MSKKFENGVHPDFDGFVPPLRGNTRILGVLDRVRRPGPPCHPCDKAEGFNHLAWTGRAYYSVSWIKDGDAIDMDWGYRADEIIDSARELFEDDSIVPDLAVYTTETDPVAIDTLRKLIADDLLQPLVVLDETASLDNRMVSQMARDRR